MKKKTKKIDDVFVENFSHISFNILSWIYLIFMFYLILEIYILNHIKNSFESVSVVIFIYIIYNQLVAKNETVEIKRMIREDKK
jgi:hypothetical protein